MIRCFFDKIIWFFLRNKIIWLDVVSKIVILQLLYALTQHVKCTIVGQLVL